jgi:hypothetical protein
MKAALFTSNALAPAFLLPEGEPELPELLVGFDFPVAVAVGPNVTDVEDEGGALKVVTPLLQIVDPASNFVG